MKLLPRSSKTTDLEGECDAPLDAIVTNVSAHPTVAERAPEEIRAYFSRPTILNGRVGRRTSVTERCGELMAVRGEISNPERLRTKTSPE